MSYILILHPHITFERVVVVTHILPWLHLHVTTNPTVDTYRLSLHFLYPYFTFKKAFIVAFSTFLQLLSSLYSLILTTLASCLQRSFRPMVRSPHFPLLHVKSSGRPILRGDGLNTRFACIISTEQRSVNTVQASEQLSSNSKYSWVAR